MARSGRECRDCDAPIEFIERQGRGWIPVEPGTERRHRCQLDQTCENCQKPFKGAPWMKTCPDCYRGGANPRSSQTAASPPRERERLKPDRDDDVPF
jgi:hypothetical protein